MKSKQLIRTGFWLIWLAGMIIIWKTMGRLVFPGILALDLPGGYTIPAGFFIAMYCIAWAALPGLVTCIDKRWSPHVMTGVILITALISRILFFPMAMEKSTTQFIIPVPATSELIMTAIGLSPCGWKIILISLDLLVVGMLIQELKYRRLPIQMSLLYAVHPLVLTSFAGLGHATLFFIACLLASIRSSHRSHPLVMFTLLGLSLQMTILSLFIWPLFIRQHNRLFALLTPAIGLLPSILSPPVRRHLLTILESYLAASASPLWLLKLALFLILWSILILRFHPSQNRNTPLDLPTLCIVTGLAFLLINPIVYPCFITLFVMLMVIRPSLSLAVLSLSISAFYVLQGYIHTTGIAYYPLSAQTCIWVPFFICLAFEIRRSASGMRHGLRPTNTDSVSVIIPTFNDQRRIQACIGSITQCKAMEVIVVDGGSTDSTCDLAIEAGAQVIVHDQPMTSGGGRGGQIHTGLIAANGDIAVVMHAGTRMTCEQIDRIRECLARNPEFSGGSVGYIYSESTLRGEMLTAFADFRAGFLALSFGDQVQFFRREWLLATGIFPDIPLMEDVELAIRMKLLGPTVYLWDRVERPLPRGRKENWKRGMLVIRLTTAWLLHRMVGTPDPVAFYKTYYNK
ncbi:glycosyltransferase [bacterium]|nr:glycosyltransferase [candidate division CSSED10-310 bacterium]